MISAIVFLPLLGAIGAGIAALLKNDALGYTFSLTGVLLSALLGWIAFITMAIPGIDQTVFLATWINVGAFQVDWALRFDTLTAVMVIVVAIVSATLDVLVLARVMVFLLFLALFQSMQKPMDGSCV